MNAAGMTITYRIDLNAPQNVQWIGTLLVQGDDSAHKIVAELYRSREKHNPADDVTALGVFVRSDGHAVALGGEIAGNTVTITLDGACYAVAGSCYLSIVLNDQGGERTVLKAAGRVDQDENNGYIDETVYTSFDELVEAAVNAYLGGSLPEGGGSGTITGPYVSTINGKSGKVTLTTSSLENDSGYITKAVSDLTNYYLKSETYTREEINQRISQIPKFTISVVSALPTSGDATTIYLVGGGISGDLYTEYIWANGAWEILGSQRVDLTGYATETWVTGQLGSYLKASELDEAINAALAQAAASGEFDGVGVDGVSLTKSPDEYGFYYIIITLTDGTQTYIPYRNGSDATVTTENIINALGYTPANAKTVDELSAAVGSSPDYVKSEADSVIERVNTAQTGRTFTFAAISDLHYGADSYTDGIMHACQGMKHIDERMKLDAVAVLGDYTDKYPAEALTESFADFRSVNTLLDDLRFAHNMRLQGNHDFYEDHAAEICRHIQAYSDDVMWGNVPNGYYYRDFDAYKMRIIAVNTIETDNVRLTVSTAQYNWFVSALDLSEKADAAQWQILVLSHHPLDWYTNDGYAFERILTAYKNGSGWSNSGGTITCDFTGKNEARLIGNIHGHIHNFLVDKLNVGDVTSGSKSDIIRIATPEACVGYNNHYNYDGWGQDNDYDKTKNTAKDTSFVVYCINLDDGIIKAICYGAGYDRIIDYINGTWTGQELKTYAITKSLSNCTATGDTTITENGTATLTITASGGYELPDTVSVAGASYTWDKATGKLTLINPSGNVTVTVAAVQTVVTPTYTNLIPASINADGTPYNGGQGWKTGYRLNSSGVEAEKEGIKVTGFMPFEVGDTVYLSGITMIAGSSAAEHYNQYICTYDTSFELIAQTKLSDAMLSSARIKATLDADNNLKSIVIDSDFFVYCGKNGVADGTSAYFRISAEEINNNSVITLNEPADKVDPVSASICGQVKCGNAICGGV